MLYIHIWEWGGGLKKQFYAKIKFIYYSFFLLLMQLFSADTIVFSKKKKSSAIYISIITVRMSKKFSSEHQNAAR